MRHETLRLATARVVVVLGLLVLPQPARGEARGPGARELLEALEHIREGRCDAAVPLLRRSYDLGEYKNALWNLAECYAVLNRPDLAIETYREYVDHPRSVPREEAEARAAIEALEGLLARVTVTGNVEGASVEVDGQPAGALPATLRLGPGEHAVAVSSPGFGTWTRTITTGAGDEQALEAELRPLPGRLSVTSEPSGAEVLVDGEPRGPAPWEGDLDGGIHVVAIRGPGLRTATRQVAVLPGQRSSVALAAEPTGGTLAVGVDASMATLRVNAEERGTSPFGPIALPPGRYALSVEALGRRRWAAAVDVLDGMTTRVDVELARSTGLHQGWFWSLLALSASTAVAGTALVLVGQDRVAAYRSDAAFVAESEVDLLQLAGRRDSGGESLDAARAYELSGWSLVGVAGLSLVATVVVGLLTRFVDSPSTAEVAVEEPQSEGEPPGGTP